MKEWKVWKNKSHTPAPSADGPTGFIKQIRRRGALPLGCYLLAVLLWLLLGVFHLASDGVARATHKLASEDLMLDAFQMVDLAPAEGGGYVTTSGDPQMILEDVGGRVVRTLSYYAEYLDAPPREICLYYTTAVGQPYSADRRVFPQVTAAGEYVFTLPRTKLAALRLDVCSPDADKPVTVLFQPQAVTLNAAALLPGPLDYFVPSWYQAFCLVLYPALAAAAISWGYAVWERLRGKMKKK